MGEMSERSVRVLEGAQTGFATTKFEDLLNWARKYSLFQYPYVTACCAMEFMAFASPRFDMARFGAEAPRFSPRQVRGGAQAALGAAARATARAPGKPR